MEAEAASLGPALHDFSVGDPIDSHHRECYPPASRRAVRLRILGMGACHSEACGNFVPVGNDVVDLGASIREPRQNDLKLFLHVLATTLRAIPAVPTDPVGGIEPIDGCHSVVISSVNNAANQRLILFRHRNPSSYERPQTTQF